MVSWSDGGQIFPHMSVARACSSPCDSVGVNIFESIFLSRVEGRGFQVEGEGSMSRVEGNLFFSKFFFFFGKGNNRCIKKNKKNLKKQIAREHLVVVGWGVRGGGWGVGGVGIEKSSETSQFVFEELHL